MKNCYLLLGMFYAFCVVNQVLSAPADSTLSFVVSSTEATNEKEGKDGTVLEDVKVPKIYQMSIKSNISNRFANTTITSKVRNIATEAQEATFSIILPKEAFISSFIMEVEGKNYTAYVKEKEEAKKQYDSAVASGLGAAHVAVSARDSNKFTVSVNIEPETKAAFYLTYEELLKRKDGRYENIINIHPGQPVKDFNVEVLISESRKIVALRAPPLRSGNEIGNEDEELDPRADIEILNDSSALVKFSPNEERQKQLAHLLKTDENGGLSGQFVVQYDVERDPKGGEVLVRDGYFVHFFAPTELEPLPKHVVFVLDVSGSMGGTKITQLKEAMQKILDQLHEKDAISLVEFSSNVKVWNLDNPSESPVHFTRSGFYGSPSEEEIVMNDKFPNVYPATADYVKKAKLGVNQFRAGGGTNIIGSLQLGLRLVESARQNKIDDIDRQPLIIFLTDGEANVGDSSTESITKKVTNENVGLRRTPIFSLSFGYGADKKFLEKLSLRNMGFSKHIYEAADAALQLEDFYNQISSPLLSNVTFNYESSDVTDITKTHFPVWYDGSELVVTGYCGRTFRAPIIEGVSSTGLLNLTPRVQNSVSDIERLWAYLTVKQLLEKKEITDDNVEEIKKRALELSLKYSFVTPLSSLVVVKPNETNAVDAEEAAVTRPHFLSSHSSNNVYAMAAPPPRRYYAADPNTFIRGGGAVPMSASVQYSGGGLRGPSIFYTATGEAPNVFVTNTVASTSNPIMIDYIGTDNPMYSSMNNLNTTLPWTVNIYNKINGFLRLPIGNFKLGPYKTITVNPNCSNAPPSGPGTCTLLKDCPQVHSLLTSADVYVQHFCALETEYAGVCCPTATEDP